MLYKQHKKLLQKDEDDSNHIWVNLMITALYKNTFLHFDNKMVQDGSSINESSKVTQF